MSSNSDAKEELEIFKQMISNTLGSKVLATLEEIAKRELEKRRKTESAK